MDPVGMLVDASPADFPQLDTPGECPRFGLVDFFDLAFHLGDVLVFGRRPVEAWGFQA